MEIIDQYTLPKSGPERGGIAGFGKYKNDIRVVIRKNGSIEFFEMVEGKEPERIMPTKEELDYAKTLADERRKAEPKTPEPKEPKGPETVTAPPTQQFIVERQPDGSMKQTPNPNYQAPRPDAPEKPTVLSGATVDKTSRFIVQQMPDGQVRRVPNPNYDPAAAQRQSQAEKRALTAAEIKEKRDKLDLDYLAGRITREQRDSDFDQWYKTRAVEHQERQAELANRREDRALRTEERVATNQERQFDRQLGQDERRARLDDSRLGFDRQNAAMEYGRGRVADYLKTMPYRAGPNFGRNFATAINGGGVNFQAEDFQFEAPDLDAMAEAAYQQAIGRFSGAAPAAPVPAAPVPAAPSPIEDIPPYVPPQRRWPVPV